MVYSIRRQMASRCKPMDVLRRKVPIIAWLPEYTIGKFFQDSLAGLTVGLTAIPQGIAYASVAGLPAQYGLYSSFMGSFVYLILGSTKDVTIGPTAITAMLTQPYVFKHGADFAVSLCFVSGAVTTIIGLLHLGFLIDFISVPVICGFTNAAAIMIGTSQITSILGIKVRSKTFIDTISNLVKHIHQTVLWDSILGLTSVLLLVGLKNLPGKRNGSGFEKCMWLLSLARNALVVFFGMVLAYALSCHDLKPFAVTGDITEGLPPFGLPPFSTTHGNQTFNFLEMIEAFGSSVVSVPAIAILETIAIAKAFAKGKTIDANQEMIALGMCNLFGSFVRSLPTAGSFTRTAVNNASGVRTPMGGIVTGCLILLACGLLTSTFKFIPKASLAAVIIVAMYYMLEFHVFPLLWRSKKIDLIPLSVTLFSCLIFELEYGMIAGIAVNLALLLYLSARPSLTIEEQIINGHSFLLVAPKQSLSFPAAEYLREQVMFWCDKKKEVDQIILDGRNVHSVDATVAKNLSLLQLDLHSRHKNLTFWNWYKEPETVITAYDPSVALHFKSTETLAFLIAENCHTNNATNVESVTID